MITSAPDFEPCKETPLAPAWPTRSGGLTGACAVARVGCLVKTCHRGQLSMHMPHHGRTCWPSHTRAYTLPQRAFPWPKGYLYTRSPCSPTSIHTRSPPSIHLELVERSALASLCKNGTFRADKSCSSEATRRALCARATCAMYGAS
jgi:hypothetical protein